MSNCSKKSGFDDDLGTYWSLSKDLLNELKLEEKHSENRKVCSVQLVFEHFRTCKIKNRQERGGRGGEEGTEPRKGW